MLAEATTDGTAKRKRDNRLPRSNLLSVLPKCRVCLKTNGEINIHDQNSDFNVVQALQLCCDIEVKVNDIYPQNLCVSCLDFLKKAFEFRTLAKKSELILKTSIFIKQEKIEETEIFQPVTTTYIGEKQNVKIEDTPRKTINIKKEKNKKTKKFNDLKIHYELVKDVCSNQSPKAKCKQCGKVFSKWYIKSHLLSAHAKSFEGFICDVCGKTFNHRPAFHVHKTMHTNILPFQCNNCPFETKNKDSLRTHMKIHSDIKKYKCPDCPAKFYRSSNLSQHKRSHGKPAFKCNICQKPYTTKRQMEYHIESQHLGIKNKFSCNLCENIYCTKKKLLSHEIKKHGREKGAHKRLLSDLRVTEKSATKMANG